MYRRRSLIHSFVLGALLLAMTADNGAPSLAHADNRNLNGHCSSRRELFQELQRKGADTRLPKPAAVGYAQYFNDPSHVSTKEVTSELTRRTVKYDSFKTKSFRYDEIVSYYKSNLTALEGLYPKGTFAFDTSRALGSYSGPKHPEMTDTHRMPFLPITVEFEEPTDVTFFRLETDFKGQKVFGLRSRFHFNRLPKQQCPDSTSMLYMPDVNARIAGFTHAQFIQALSENVTPGDYYFYNGFHEWSTHSRYKRLDQSSRAIDLTNYSHAGGGDGYYVSDLPDFSLTLYDYDVQTSLVTFFLWRDGPRLGSPDHIPDFVYQMELVFNSPS